MTMDDIAYACGFSKSYVNFLKKRIHSTTQKTVSPKIKMLEKIARDTTSQDVDSLLKILDDKQQITINPNLLSMNDEEKKVYNRLLQIKPKRAKYFVGNTKIVMQSYPVIAQCKQALQSGG